MKNKFKITLFIILITAWIIGIYHIHTLRAKNLIVETDMFALQDGYIQLFADDGQGFREELSARQSFVGDNNLHNFQLSMNISKGISALRIDPVNMKGQVHIRRITVRWMDESYTFQGKELEKWQMYHDLEKISDKQDFLLNASGDDPQLMLPVQLSYSYKKQLFLFIKQYWAMMLLGIFIISVCFTERLRIYRIRSNGFFSHLFLMVKENKSKLLWSSILLTVWIFILYQIYILNFRNLNIEIDMTSWQKGIVQCFADDGDGFREDLSDRQVVLGDSNQHNIKLSIGILKDISALRIDPVNTKGRIRIDGITVRWQGESYIFKKKELEKWQLHHDLSIENSSDDQGLLLNAPGDDPQLMLPIQLSYSYQKTLSSFFKKNSGMIFFGLLLIFLFYSKESLSYPPPKNLSFSSICAMLLPLVLFWVLYYPAINTWWLYDDSCHLVYIMKNSIYAAFFDKNNGFSYVNFTPLEPLSLGADFHLFGFDPKGFYWHHLISFSFALIASYLLLVRFFPVILSGFILSWFVASVPVCEAVFFLMVRHYIEGLFFTMISIYFFMMSLQKDKQIWSYAGALLYLLACLSKELYVPLVVILLFFPEIKVRSRLKFLYPYFGAALIYTCWRLYMLNFKGVVAGYPGHSLLLKDVLSFPLSAFGLMDWQNYSQWIFILLMGSGFLWVFRTWTFRKKLIVLIFFICGFLPILKVLANATRFLFVVSFLVYICLGIGLGYISRISSSLLIRKLAVMLIGGGLILTSFFSILQHVSALQQKAKNIEVEGKFLLYSNKGSENVLLTDNGHCYSAFITLRKELLGLSPGPLYCMNNDCGCAYLHHDKQAWVSSGEYLFSSGILSDRKQIIPEECGIRKELSVYISYRDGKVTWQFGPYKDEAYMLYMGNTDKSQFIEISSKGERSYEKKVKDISFIVIYKSPEGWETYSPMLTFTTPDPKNEYGYIKWERKTP
ncbi:MAG TPA: hypothetical protein DCQ37_00755 [Desulfobacteraceae bacterium]|nr:hypothetical protein [Desulfobacteraceae bacterium]